MYATRVRDTAVVLPNRVVSRGVNECADCVTVTA